MNKYQVIVSNIGTVYDGNDEQEAKGAYDEYRTNSELAMGRAAGEDVTLMADGEPLVEYIGVLHREEETLGSSAAEEECACPACNARRSLVDAISKIGEALKAQKAGGPFLTFSQAMAYIETLGDTYTSGPHEIAQVASQGFQIDGESWTIYVYAYEGQWHINKDNNNLDGALVNAMALYNSTNNGMY